MSAPSPCPHPWPGPAARPLFLFQWFAVVRIRPIPVKFDSMDGGQLPELRTAAYRCPVPACWRVSWFSSLFPFPGLGSNPTGPTLRGGIVIFASSRYHLAGGSILGGPTSSGRYIQSASSLPVRRAGEVLSVPDSRDRCLIVTQPVSLEGLSFWALPAAVRVVWQSQRCGVAKRE